MTRYPKKQVDFNLSNYDLDQLPHGDGLEQEILGCILIRPENLMRCVKYLNVEGMFYTDCGERLWKQLITWDAARAPRSFNDAVKHYKAVGEMEMHTFLFDCYGKATHDAHLERLCLRLNEYWIVRTIHRLGYFLNQNSLNKEADALETLGEASDGLAKIYSHISAMRESTVADGFDELTQELAAIAASPDGMLGIRGAVYGISRILKGYRNAGLIVVGASTGEGKSTYAYADALEMAKKGLPVGIVSLEMKTSEILLIMACNHINITMEVVLDGKLNPLQASELETAKNYIKSLPIKILDTGGLRCGEVKAAIRMWHKKDGIRIAMVDHIHLVRADSTPQSQEQRFTDIANDLKALAKDLNIPIIALAQLSRKESSEKKRPHEVTDIKYASGIEQAADVVILIYRPEMYGIETDPNGNSTKGYARLIVAKLRLIKKKNVSCHFDGLRFTDIDEYQNGNYRRPFTLEDAEPMTFDNPSAGISSRTFNNTPYDHDEQPF